MGFASGSENQSQSFVHFVLSVENVLYGKTNGYCFIYWYEPENIPVYLNLILVWNQESEWLYLPDRSSPAVWRDKWENNMKLEQSLASLLDVRE